MKRLIITICLFFLGCALGFGGAKLVKHLVSSNKATIHVTGGGGGSTSSKTDIEAQTQHHDAPVERMDVDTLGIHSGIADTSATVASMDSLVTPIVESAGYAQRVVKLDTYFYNLVGIKASVPDGSDMVFHLESVSDPAYSVSSSSPSFTEVPPSASGVYRLTVVNTVKGVSAGPYEIKGFTICKPIEKLSAEQLAEIYQSGNWEANRNILESKFRPSGKRNIDYKITYNGMDTSSEINELPATHQGVMQKFKTGAWSTLTITEVEYDALGYIVSINIHYTK